jgi:hypothetical protein
MRRGGPAGFPHHLKFGGHLLWAQVRSDHPNRLKAEQRPQLLDAFGNVTDADGTVVCRTLPVPSVDELARAAGEPIPAVRVPDENLTR